MESYNRTMKLIDKHAKKTSRLDRLTRERVNQTLDMFRLAQSGGAAGQEIQTWVSSNTLQNVISGIRHAQIRHLVRQGQEALDPQLNTIESRLDKNEEDHKSIEDGLASLRKDLLSANDRLQTTSAHDPGQIANIKRELEDVQKQITEFTRKLDEVNRSVDEKVDSLKGLPLETLWDYLSLRQSMLNTELLSLYKPLQYMLSTEDLTNLGVPEEDAIPLGSLPVDIRNAIAVFEDARKDLVQFSMEKSQRFAIPDQDEFTKWLDGKRDLLLSVLRRFEEVDASIMKGDVSHFAKYLTKYFRFVSVIRQLSLKNDKPNLDAVLRLAKQFANVKKDKSFEFEDREYENQMTILLPNWKRETDAIFVDEF